LAVSKNLLNSNQFGSITADTFFAAIPLPSALNGVTTIKEYMEPWILQKNYPEVDVLLSVSSGNTRVTFKQARYLVSDVDIVEGPDQPKLVQTKMITFFFRVDALKGWIKEGWTIGGQPFQMVNAM
jgi:hypothetical protein